METPAVPALLIGALFVEKRLITQEQLAIALEEQRRTGNRLGEVLVERFGVSRLDLADALAEQWAEYERQGTAEQRESPSESPAPVVLVDERGGAPEDSDAGGKRPIGEIFLERGMVSSDELERALDEQRESGRRLGEILVEKGNLSRLELASALADQWASFQKLRPPSASNGAAAPDPAPAPVMPTPEVSPASSSTPLVSGASSDQVDALRGRLEALGTQLDQLSLTRHEWREPLEQLAASVGERLGAVEQAATDRSTALADADASRAEIGALEARLDALAQQPVPDLEELRASLSALATRIEQPVTADEWREPLESLAGDLRDRIATIEQTRSSASNEATDALRADLASLTARVEAIPAPSEDWRDGLARLAARINSITVPTDEWREELRALSTRLDELSVPNGGWRDALVASGELSDDWRHELAQVAGDLRARVERVEAGLDQRAGFDLLAGLRDELQALSARIDADLQERDERAAGQGSHVEWLADRVSHSEGIEQRLRDEFAPLVEGAATAFAERLVGVEGSLEEHRSGGAGLTRRLDDLTERLDEQARRIEELRDDGPTAAQVAEALGARLETSEAVATDVYASLDERLAALDGQVASVSDRAASDVESLRRELEDLRRDTVAADGSIADAGADSRAVLDRLDGLVAAQAAALDLLQVRLDERERLSDERLSALEKSQAKRSDVRELREALGRVEQHIAAEMGKEDTRVVAVEEALRDGLASLAARLSETEGAYFQAGDSLRRSIEHLGSAIRGADAHRAPSGDVSDDPIVATSFLAFAPTPEGYRLVELDGAAPVIGGLVEVSGCETPLVVARLGASPLPFDRRPCAYLELAV